MVDLLLANPFIIVTRVQHALRVTRQGAGNIVLSVVELGWLTELEGRGRGERDCWPTQGVYDAIKAPTRR